FRALYRFDERHLRLAFAEAIRELTAQLLDVTDTAPHEPLYRYDGVQRIAGSRLFSGITDIDMIGVIAHGRGQNQLPLGVGQRRGDATAQRCNQRISGTQVDAHSQTTLMRLRALSWLGNLK